MQCTHGHAMPASKVFAPLRVELTRPNVEICEIQGEEEDAEERKLDTNQLEIWVEGEWTMATRTTLLHPPWRWMVQVTNSYRRVPTPAAVAKAHHVMRLLTQYAKTLWPRHKGAA